MTELRPDRVGDKKRVLIVEDDPDLCLLIERLASQLSIEVELCFARSVDEAVLHLDQSQDFDLILADFLLADSKNGYQLQQLCADRAPNSNFAMMSSMPIQLPDAREADFLQKPFTQSSCLQFLTEHLSN